MVQQSLGVLCATLLVVGIVACSSAPAPQPTTQPAQGLAEPTKAPAAAAAPTSAPALAAQPTAVPPPKVSFPEKGRTINIIIAWAAGSVNDILFRMAAPYLEKQLGVPVQVVDKPGAGSQVGMTELAQAKPDGYTIGHNSMPTTPIVYMDPARKAAFNRKSFEPICVLVQEPMLLAVKGDGKFKTAKELFDAAKANPGKIKVGDAGHMTPGHLGVIALAKSAAVEFASVHFGGDVESYTALLGDNIDATIAFTASVMPHYKSGAIRMVGVMDTEPSKFFPDVKPLRDQGYDAQVVMSRAVAAPGGTPKEMVDVLSNAFAAVAKDEDFNKKALEAGFVVKYLNPQQSASQWDQMELQVKAALEVAKAETK
ncbi:MAG: tripartite tricarboxylate transporter substrate binding protein [Chloroflexota bacterium]